jgi:hypothetical protein
MTSVSQAPLPAPTAPVHPPQAPTYVVGHRNPDADAICSAIAYAAYKEARGEPGYIAARCGNSNARIDTILARFHQPLPHYLSDVSPRVHDLMTRAVVSIGENATCAEALELIDHHHVRVLPVTTGHRKPVGTVSLAHLGSVFIPRVNEPRLMRQVHTSLAAIARALQGRVIHLPAGDQVEDFYVRLGTMDIQSFWSISIRENIPAAQSIIIGISCRVIALISKSLCKRSLRLPLKIDERPAASAVVRQACRHYLGGVQVGNGHNPSGLSDFLGLVAFTAGAEVTVLVAALVSAADAGTISAGVVFWGAGLASGFAALCFCTNGWVSAFAGVDLDRAALDGAAFGGAALTTTFLTVAAFGTGFATSFSASALATGSEVSVLATGAAGNASAGALTEVSTHGSGKGSTNASAAITAGFSAGASTTTVTCGATGVSSATAGATLAAGICAATTRGVA